MFNVKRKNFWIFKESFVLPFSKSVSLNFQYAKFHAKIKKILTFRSKNALLGYFRAGIQKSDCHIWNQRPRFCVIVKFGTKQKSLNLGLKIPDLGIFRQKLDNHIVIFEISTLEFAYLQNFGKKIWDQKCVISVFLGWNLKITLSYLKSKPSNLSIYQISWNSENA